MLAREADLVIGVGTRSATSRPRRKTMFQHPRCTFININVAEFDASKLAGAAVVADARVALRAAQLSRGAVAAPPAYPQPTERSSDGKPGT